MAFFRKANRHSLKVRHSGRTGLRTAKGSRKIGNGDTGAGKLPFYSKRKYVHFGESGECSTLQLREWTYLLLQ